MYIQINGLFSYSGSNFDSPEFRKKFLTQRKILTDTEGKVPKTKIQKTLYKRKTNNAIDYIPLLIKYIPSR